jgi:hypothetical protein
VRSDHKRLEAPAAFALYLLASVLLFAAPILAHPSRDCLCIPTTTDEGIIAWGLAWWPHALVHGLNPFFTRLIYAPQGINLAHGTLMPGLALLLAPVTALTSPLFSFNLAATLAPALAAFTTFLLCRRIAGSFLPSLVGGWLFGFSTYMLGQETGHLDLTLVFLVPAIVHLTLNAAAGTVSRRRSIVPLALALVGQISLSLEIFATLTVLGVIALGVAWVLGGDAIQASLRRAIAILAIAYAVALLITSPYLYYALQPGSEPVLLWRSTEFSNDLLSFIVPSRLVKAGGIHFLSTTERFTAGYVEGAAYLGVPLLLISLLALWRGRRQFEIRLLGVMLAVALLCSLGPYLHVDGHRLLPLPWDLAARLPLLGVALPSRLIMYATLIVAVLAAVWLAGTPGPRAGGWLRSQAWRLALAAISVASLWPDTRYPFWHSQPQLPALFQSSAYRRVLRPRDTVLALPVGIEGNSMLWQAQTHLSFTMASGYVVSPEAANPYSSAPIDPTLLYDATVPDEERAAAQFIAAHHVTVAVMTPVFARVSPWPRILRGLGWHAETVDGAVVVRP